MIQSDYSGVIFTANPTGILNEMVIVAGEGLGCNIVEDKISTTTYYYKVDDKNYYFENENILNKNILKDLIEIAVKIKKFFRKIWILSMQLKMIMSTFYRQDQLQL